MRKFFLIILLLGCILMAPWGIISVTTYDRVYRDIEDIPVRDVGLLLGTTPSVQ